jgi:hypothetical protein
MFIFSRRGHQHRVERASSGVRKPIARYLSHAESHFLFFIKENSILAFLIEFCENIARQIHWWLTYGKNSRSDN